MKKMKGRLRVKKNKDTDSVTTLLQLQDRLTKLEVLVCGMNDEMITLASSLGADVGTAQRDMLSVKANVGELDNAVRLMLTRLDKLSRT